MFFNRFVLLFSLLFSISSLEASITGDFDPKLAYDSINDEYLMVYQHISRTYDVVNDTYIYYYHIRGQKLDSEGKPKGIAFDIDNADIATTFRGKPDVYCPNEPGDCLVVWEDNRDSRTTIYGRYIPNVSGLIDTEFLISSGNTNQRYPSVAYGNEYYMVVWEQEEQNGFQVYSAIFKNKLSIPSDRIVHNNTGMTSGRPQPDIEYDPDSKNFVIVFRKKRNTFYEDILAFIHSADSNPVLLLYYNITGSDTTKIDPTLSYNPEKKEMLIAFSELDNIKLQRFGNIGTAPGNIGSVSGSGNLCNAQHLSLEWNDKRKEYLLAMITSCSSQKYECQGMQINAEGVVTPPFLLKKGADHVSVAKGRNEWMVACELFSDKLVSPELKVFKWPVLAYPALYYLLF